MKHSDIDTPMKRKRKYNELSAVEVGTAKVKDRPYKLADGGGLYVVINPNGSKLWRLKYYSPTTKKEKTLSIGQYPVITLKNAREQMILAKQQIAKGLDPSSEKKAVKEIASGVHLDSFEFVAREWHSKFLHTWKPSHAKTIIDRLKLNVFPWLGSIPLSEITPPQILEVLRRIESRGALETAHRVRTICGQVFRYGIATSRAERDMAADLIGALPPATTKHLAAITDPQKVGELLRAIDSFEGTFIVKSALRFAPLVFARPIEMRQAVWSEIDLDAALWSIPAERMKIKLAHIVPLSTQAVEILRELHPLTGTGKYLFPSVRSELKSMSDNTLNAALRRIGYSKDKMTTHGFRAMARTIVNATPNPQLFAAE